MLLCLLSVAMMDGYLRKLFFGLRPGASGAVWVHAWCKCIVRALDIPCEVHGLPPAAPDGSVAMVSNHLSYLDILLYAAIRPFVMVAKSEVRDWPLIGWITAQAGTVYVQRAELKGGRTQTRDEVNAAMREALGSGLPVLFFPEGTTSDGEGVLPFRRGLFHSVIEARVPLRVSAVAYSLAEPHSGASVASDVCFWGDMVFGPHLFRCLGVRGLRAHVCFGAEEVTGENRFELASCAHDRVLELFSALNSSKECVAEQSGRLCVSRVYPST